MKILIIKNDGFGDLLLSTPIINIISKNLKYKIDLVLSHNQQDLKNKIKNVKKIYFYDKFDIFKSTQKINKYNNFKILNEIKKTNYDVCVVLRRLINSEQIEIMKNVNSKKKYICNNIFFKNDNNERKNNIELRKWTKIEVIDNCKNDTEYFWQFIKKIKLTKLKSIPIKKIYHKKKNKRLILNLSGEKQFSDINSLEILLNAILKFHKHQIVIIGKTFDYDFNFKVSKYLSSIKNKKIINLFDKTDFKISMKMIRDSSFYVGFETGLTHYAVLMGIKSLVILASGGGFKWFPYPKKIRRNETYWIYNTPCADCHYSGSVSQCIFMKKLCVDNIFINYKFLEKNMYNFLYNKNEFINYSDNNLFMSNWSFFSKNKNLYEIKTNGQLKKTNSPLSLLIFLKNWLVFIYKNRLIEITLSKITNKIKLCFKVF